MIARTSAHRANVYGLVSDANGSATDIEFFSGGAELHPTAEVKPC